jgi:hypothetical protein
MSFLYPTTHPALTGAEWNDDTDTGPVELRVHISSPNPHVIPSPDVSAPPSITTSATTSAQPTGSTASPNAPDDLAGSGSPDAVSILLLTAALAVVGITGVLARARAWFGAI